MKYSAVITNFTLTTIVILSLLLNCCKKAEVPAPILAPGTISAEYISHTPTELKFKVRFFVLDSRNNNDLTEMDIANSIYIDSFTDDFGTQFSYTLNSVKKVTTPLLGKASTAVMWDLSEIEEDKYNWFGPQYMQNQEIACRKFFKLSPPENEFVFAAYSTNNYYIPNDTINIFSNGFTNNTSFYDQRLAQFRNNTIYYGLTPVRQALDTMLDFTISKAKNANKQIIAFTHSEDNMGGPYWNSIIQKAKGNNIPINVVMNYQSDGNFPDYIKLACSTGGFVFYVSNYLDGRSLPVLASGLNNIVQGNFTCFESEWTANVSSEVFAPGFVEASYIELKINNNYNLFPYMPFYVEIP